MTANKPDLFADPVGYRQWLIIKSRKRAAFVNRSFNKLKRRNAKEFDAAYGALLALNPNNRLHRNIVQKIYAADNPATALLQWWRGPAKTKGKVNE